MVSCYFLRLLMRKTAISLAFLAVLSGCATKKQMTQDTYQTFSRAGVIADVCLAEGHITPQMYGDIRQALHTLLSSWTFDMNELNSTTSIMQRLYPTRSAQECRRFEGEAYSLIAQANQHRAAVQENQRSFNNAVNQLSFPRPIYCNRIGTMTMCN